MRSKKRNPRDRITILFGLLTCLYLSSCLSSVRVGCDPSVPVHDVDLYMNLCTDTGHTCDCSSEIDFPSNPGFGDFASSSSPNDKQWYLKVTIDGSCDAFSSDPYVLVYDRVGGFSDLDFQGRTLRIRNIPAFNSEFVKIKFELFEPCHRDRQLCCSTDYTRAIYTEVTTLIPSSHTFDQIRLDIHNKECLPSCI